MEKEVKNNGNIIKNFLDFFNKYFQISIYQEIIVKFRIFQFNFFYLYNFYNYFKNYQ
jgi:hypothetical protein